MGKSYLSSYVNIFYDSDMRHICIILNTYGCARMYASEKKIYNFTGIHLHM